MICKEALACLKGGFGVFVLGFYKPLPTFLIAIKQSATWTLTKLFGAFIHDAGFDK